MIKKFIKKRIEKNKKDMLFEIEHKDYFIPLYIRVIILCLLVATAVYYASSLSICNSWGGQIVTNTSFYKVSCISKAPLYNPYNDFDLSTYNITPIE